MTRDVAIVGAGGIGQRHAQSCATLPAADYRLHLVEPNDENRARTSALLGGREAVNWYKSVGDLPEAIDLAIVATRADIRARVTAEILQRTIARSLILEKVLFQKVSDYAATGDLLSRAGASARVNCPRRMWPAYKKLRGELVGQEIVRVDVSGANWDIGCNAIHFIDLIAFLTQASQVVVDEVRLGDVWPAKRDGMLHIEGEVIGHLSRGVTRVPFRIASTPAHQGPQTVRIEATKGIYEIAESASTMTATAPDEAPSTIPIPFQSQLTASAVQGILVDGRCDLALYEESRALHERFIAALLPALDRAGKLADREVCPIT